MLKRIVSIVVVITLLVTSIAVIPAQAIENDPSGIEDAVLDGVQQGERLYFLFPHPHWDSQSTQGSLHCHLWEDGGAVEGTWGGDDESCQYDDEKCLFDSDLDMWYYTPKKDGNWNRAIFYLYPYSKNNSFRPKTETIVVDRESVEAHKYISVTNENVADTSNPSYYNYCVAWHDKNEKFINYEYNYDLYYEVTDKNEIKLNDCYCGLHGVEIPSELNGLSVTSIGSECFINDFSAQNIIIPASVTNLDNSAFYHCENLKNIFIYGDNVTTGFTLAEGCHNLRYIFVPRNFDAIGLCAALVNDFGEEAAKNISIIKCNDVAQAADAMIYGGNIDDVVTAEFTVVNGVLTAYSGQGGDMVIPRSIKAIGKEVFKNNTSITSVTFNPGLTVIGESAFAGCSGLTGSLVIPDTVTKIGSKAFENCTGLSGTLTLSENLEQLGPAAFSGCSGFTGVLTIPDSVRYIGFTSFKNCTGFTEIVYGSGLTTFYDKIDETAEAADTDTSTDTSTDSSSEYGREDEEGHAERPSHDVYMDIDDLEDPFFDEEYISPYVHALQGCENVEKITFKSGLPYFCRYNTGEEVDKSFIDPFLCKRSFAKLNEIIVPSESYNLYRSTFETYLPSGVTLRADSDLIPVSGLTAVNVYSKTATLRWTAPSVGDVQEYIILRDSVEVGRTADLTFTDTALTPGESYTYSVVCQLTDERTTDPAQVNVTTCAPLILRIATENSGDRLSPVKNRIFVYADNNNSMTEHGGKKPAAALYYIKDNTKTYIGDCELSEELSSGFELAYTARWDMADDIQSGEYTVQAVLTDPDSAVCESELTVNVDCTVPQKIINLTVTGDYSSIHLAWSMSSEVSSTIYNIYRKTDGDLELIARSTGRMELNYIDTNVVPDTEYTYCVTTVNELGMESELSDEAVGKMAEDTEPPAVTRLEPGSGAFICGSCSVMAAAQDNVKVSSTSLWYSVDGRATWTLMDTSSSGSVRSSIDTTKLPDGKIAFKGEAEDSSGNKSDPFICECMIDNTGPSKVEELSYVSTSVTASISWSDVPDNDRGFFRVEQKNEATGEYTKYSDVSDKLGINIYDLTPGQIRTYRVVCFDNLGNRGVPSDDIVVTTLNDETPPVVTSLSPMPGRFNSTINLSATVKDEYSVARVVLQISQNGETWQDVYTKTYSEGTKTAYAVYTLELSDYPEASLLFRAKAADAFGNESDTSISAPFVQYAVDRTAPLAPTDVSITRGVGYITVSWKQGSEEDLGKYYVYRSLSENGEYTQIAAVPDKLGYSDRTVEESVEYYYKIKADDLAGNVSEFSEVVSGSVISDTEPPTIVSVYPESGEILGGEKCSVSALITDNKGISSVLFEYKTGDGGYTAFKNSTGLSGYSRTAAASLPVSELTSGTAVSVRISVVDSSGNAAEPAVREYTVDNTAPSISSVAAEYSDNGVNVNIRGFAEDDLAGYRIYRKTSGSSYSLVGQKASEKDASVYTFADYTVSDDSVTYIYKVEAVDQCGNTSFKETAPVTLPDRSYPTPVLSCDSVMEKGVEYEFDASGSSDNSLIAAYSIDFGDGSDTVYSRKAVHAYSETGTYTVTLKVTDDSGNESSLQKNITVKERVLIGKAEIRIVDTNGSPVPNAPVYFDLGQEKQVIRPTDGSGIARFSADAGKHTVGCVIANNEWLPVKHDIIVEANKTTSVDMTLVHKALVEGEFEITRMDLEQIIAAGIDIAKPENQYYVEVHTVVRLDEVPYETSFHFNPITGGSDAKPMIVEGGGGKKREIIPVVIPPKGGELEDIDLSQFTASDFEASVAKSTVAFLDIPVGVSTLKEFYNVDLHIINNAQSEFCLYDNFVRLNIPDGLSLVTESVVSEKSALVSRAQIKGQTTETITWILRGDEIGSYYLSADYTGVLGEFGARINAHFDATQPIDVYGLENLRLIIDVPEETQDGEFYYNTTLINDGRTDIYRPRMETDDFVIETEYFDAAGAAVAENYDSGKIIQKLGLSTSVIGDVDVLGAGCRVTKHFVCLDELPYSNKTTKVTNFATGFRQMYGLTTRNVIIRQQPLSYFTKYIDPAINAVEKADATFNVNQNAYDYLMDNNNYMYWALYNAASNTESDTNALPSKNQQNVYNAIKLYVGSGSADELFHLDDEEQIKQIILDAMEVNVEDNEYKQYETGLKFLKAAKEFCEKTGVKKWLSSKFEQKGELIPQTFIAINEDYKWDFYQACSKGHVEFDGIIVQVMSKVDAKMFADSGEFTQDDYTKQLRDLYSAEGFEQIWGAIGNTINFAETEMVEAFRTVDYDASLFVTAQANIESCNTCSSTRSSIMFRE